MKTKFILRLKKVANYFKRKKSGQTLVEYALILAFISVVAISVLQALGSKVTKAFSTINSKLDQAQQSH